MKASMIRLLLIAFLLAVWHLTGPSAGAADQLLPNLQALPARDIRLTTTTTGALWLRFTTISSNVGRGPLELRSGDVTNGRQKVWQRVYDDAGGYQDYLAGDFVHHPAHNHIHFEDYALYEVQPVDAPGASARTGSKVTFCVMDTTRINTKLPGAPKKAIYKTCGNQLQGLSVGWGDKYRYNLAGQSIDVTGLPNGIYALRITVDPKNLLHETNDNDNLSEVRIQLVDGTVKVL